MFTLWDIKYEDEISKCCCNDFARFYFDTAALDTGLPSIYRQAVRFRNRMNKLSDKFYRKFKRVMKEHYDSTLNITRAVPYIKLSSYGDRCCIYYEAINKDGRNICDEIIIPYYGHAEDGFNRERIVMGLLRDDILYIDKLMAKYWIRTNRQYSEIGYTCRENYTIKED